MRQWLLDRGCHDEEGRDLEDLVGSGAPRVPKMRQQIKALCLFSRRCDGGGEVDAPAGEEAALYKGASERATCFSFCN